MNQNIEYNEKIRKIWIENPYTYKYILKQPENKYLLDYLNSWEPDKISLEPLKVKIIWVLNNITDFPICANENCNNKTKIKGDKYCSFCSNACASRSPLRTEKIKQTFLKKYGVENVFQSEKIKEKCKNIKLEKYGDENFNNREKSRQTCLEKYGVENYVETEKFKLQAEQSILNHYGVSDALKSPIIKEKIKQTKFEKYGDENFNNREKSRQTCLEKYGTKVPNIIGSEDFKQSMLKKYGVDHPSKLSSTKEKSKQTCLEKYGVENYSKTDEYKERIKKTNLEKYGEEWSFQNHSIRIKQQQPYYFDNRYFQVSSELACYIYLKDHKIDFEYQPNISFEYVYENKIHKYFPDFRVQNELWELKGDYFIGENDTWICPWDKSSNGIYEAKHQCCLKNNVKILYKNEYIKFIQYVNDTYGKNYLKSFKINKDTDFDELEYFTIEKEKIDSTFAETMFKEHGIESLNLFKTFDFPYFNIDAKSLKHEWNILQNHQKSIKSPSKLIRHFHRSMWNCNRYGQMSPIDFWIDFKNTDINTWKKFYINRFIYANSKSADEFRKTGLLSPDLIRNGFSILHMAQCVSYLKPMLAKQICSSFLEKFETVFCPMHGFSGIMLGTLGCNKNYIGQDLNKLQIEEATNLLEFIKQNSKFSLNVKLCQQDVFNDSGNYECLFCCPPYENIEQWNFDDNHKNIDQNLTCDEWIDILVERYVCKKYVFIVDDKITKYKNKIVKTLCNNSHFGKNIENIVVI